jgi:2,3-bisphosphoglycerate-independent phosphoglycerate mutase
MQNSHEVLKHQPVNYRRVASGQMPSTSIWLFWGSGPIPKTPSFKETYHLSAALTSGVDLLRGLGMMMGMDILDISGITDNMTNDFAEQAEGALAALDGHDLVVIHVEAPDEAGHAGNAAEKIEAIEKIDSEIVSRIRRYNGKLRLLIMPDHPTPVEMRTHVAEPVPFLMGGVGFEAGKARRFTENETKNTDVLIHKGHDLMRCFIGGC